MAQVSYEVHRLYSVLFLRYISLKYTSLRDMSYSQTSLYYLIFFMVKLVGLVIIFIYWPSADHLVENYNIIASIMTQFTTEDYLL